MVPVHLLIRHSGSHVPDHIVELRLEAENANAPTYADCRYWIAYEGMDIAMFSSTTPPTPRQLIRGYMQLALEELRCHTSGYKNLRWRNVRFTLIFPETVTL